jgi:hypothetical protein
VQAVHVRREPGEPGPRSIRQHQAGRFLTCLRDLIVEGKTICRHYRKTPKDRFQGESDQWRDKKMTPFLQHQFLSRLTMKTKCFFFTSKIQ